MPQKTILVAGAGGFIGSHTVEHLARAGYCVVALDRPGADLSVAQAAGATVLSLDLFDQPAVVQALKGCEAAINATGLFDLGSSPEALRKINVDAASAFAQAVVAAGVPRLVHISTVGVYGPPALSPMPEDGPLRPKIPYEHSKLEGERATMAFHGKGTQVAVLRPTLVYGPRSRYGQALFIALLAQLKAHGWQRFPFLRGGPLGHHVHVADVARAAILLATHPDAPGKAFNVADDVPLGLGDTLGAMVERCGLRPAFNLGSKLLWRIIIWVLNHLPDFSIHRYNRWLARGHERLVKQGLPPVLAPKLDRDWLAYFAGSHVYDTRALKALGFAAAYPDFRAGVADVVEWYERAGWLPAPVAKKELPSGAQQQEVAR